MEKKNLLVRALVPVVLAGLVFVGFSACSQDDGYPEGFVLNDETGAATLAKRSMPQGGESTKPVEPEKPSDSHGQASVTFKRISEVPEKYKDKYPEIKAICVGEGEKLLELQGEVKNRGLKDKVTFLGFRNDIGY